MSGVRYGLCAVLGAVAALLAAICVPAAATAASLSPNINIISAGPDSNGDPYDLTVVANDGNGAQIATMTAHVFNSSGTDVADPTLQYVSGAPSAQTWSASAAPISQSVLVPGTYTVTVDAADTTETDTGLVAPGSFSFSYATSITVTPSQSDVTEGSQNVTFTGNVTGVAPGGTPTPIPNAQISLSIGGATSTNVQTTDQNGNFIYPATNVEPAGYNFSVVPTSTYGTSNDDVTIGASLAATTMTVTPSPPNITQGTESVTFTGNVSTAGGSIPIAGAPVSLSIGGGPTVSTGLSTDSNGNFSFTEANPQATDYNFSIPSGTLYSGTADDVTVGISAAATSMTVTASPSSVSLGEQTVTFAGTVLTTSGSVPIVGAPVSVSIGGATAISTGATTNSSGQFTYTLSGAAATDYDFSIPSSTLYNGTAKDITVGASAAPTTVTMNTPSPPTVTLGSTTVAFSGTVTATPSGSGITAPVPVAGAQILLSIGGGTPAAVTTTNSSGQFTWPVMNISGTNTYTFSVAGTPLYGSSTAATQTVNAVAAPTTVAVTPAATTVTEGSNTINFSGTVTASPSGGTKTPLSGLPVSVSIGGATPVPTGATTNSAGDFSYQASNITANTTYVFSTPGSTFYTGGSSAALTATTQQATSAISVTAVPSDVFFTMPVTYSGTVTAKQANGTVVPVPGAQVSLQAPAAVTGVTNPIATTNSQGQFTYTLDSSSGQYQFSIAGTNLYTAALTDVPLGIDEAKTSIVVSPSPATVTEGSQSVTFSGTVTGVPNGSTKAQDLAGATVNLQVSNEAPTNDVATTNSSGMFSYTVSGISATADYSFTVNPTPEYTTAQTEVQVMTKQAETRITDIMMSPADLKYGQMVTISGTAQYQFGTSWAALPGSAMQVRTGNFRPTTVDTSAAGSFSVRLRTTHGANWVATLSQGPLIEQASMSGYLTIQVPMKVRSFGAGLNVNDNVVASGCVQVAVGYTRGPQSPQAIVIQYATRSRGPWRALGEVDLHNGGHAPPNCRSTSESYFDGSIHARLASAYYRADFPGDLNFGPAVSGVVHAARTQTKITSFQVTPNVVDYKGTVTISGQLWRKGRTWQPYADRPIKIIFHEKGTPYWSAFPGTVTTNSRGYFTAQGQDFTRYTFVAVFYGQYSGSKTDLAVRSSGIDVTVKAQGDGQDQTGPDLLPSILAPATSQLPILAVEGVAIKTELEHMLQARGRN